MAISSDDVMFWDSCIATQEMPSKSKGKMKYQFDKELAHRTPSQFTSILDNVLDTKIRHVDMTDFLQRIETPVDHEMKHIKRSHIRLVSTFPMAAMELEFVLGCTKCLSPKSMTIEDVDGRVVISLNSEVIKQIFKVPHNAECVDLTKQSSLEIWNEKKGDYKKYVNQYWLDTKRNNFSRWPKTVHRSNFKQEYKDLIILFRRVCGLKDSTNFEPWMYKFIF